MNLHDPTYQDNDPNPYLDEFIGVGGSSGVDFAVLSKRREMVGRYAWAVPNGAAISALIDLGPIVEIGAGLGYWASLITQRGGDIVAYDASFGSDNKFVNDDAQPFHPVIPGSAEMAGLHTDRALMLCWPPYAEAMAHNALMWYEVHGGHTVAYIGEGYGGCTGCDEFHLSLKRHWRLDKVVTIPQWYGIRDGLMIYRRPRKFPYRRGT